MAPAALRFRTNRSSHHNSIASTHRLGLTNQAQYQLYISTLSSNMLLYIQHIFSAFSFPWRLGLGARQYMVHTFEAPRHASGRRLFNLTTHLRLQRTEDALQKGETPKNLCCIFLQRYPTSLPSTALVKNSTLSVYRDGTLHSRWKPAIMP